jgi:hypothetical protein
VVEREGACLGLANQAHSQGLAQPLLNGLRLLTDHVGQEREIECSADDRGGAEQIDNLR